MPQLDTSTFTSQLFWLCICFFSMLFIMSKFITPRIADILALRQKKIDAYLDKARETKEKAEESLAKYQEALAQATLNANKSLEKTQKDLNDLITKKHNDLAQNLHSKIKDSEAKITQSKQEALAKVKEMSEELALDVVNKIGLKDISQQDIKTAIKDL